MEIKSLTSAISELGFPIIAALFLGVILYKSGTYLLKIAQQLFGSQQQDRLNEIKSIHTSVVKEIEDWKELNGEEINEIQKQFSTITTMQVRLTDRVRQLSTSIYDLDVACRIFFNMPQKKEHPQTTADRREELEDKLSELNPHNGNHK